MAENNTRYGTAYLETEAILAAQEQDDAYLDVVLSKLNRREIVNLGHAADHLAAACRDVLRSALVEEARRG